VRRCSGVVQDGEEEFSIGLLLLKRTESHDFLCH
jgi:hypothetical protein